MVPSCIVFKNSSVFIHMDNTGRTRSTANQQSKTSTFQINNNMSATRLVDYVIIMYYVNFWLVSVGAAGVFFALFVFLLVPLCLPIWLTPLEPPLGHLPHSQVSYCWWLPAVCMQRWVTLTELGSHLWNLPLVVWHIHRWVTADGCLLYACKGELRLQSWVPTCGTSPWLSGTFTGELLLMALGSVCVCACVHACACVRVCVCVCKGKSWLGSQSFVEPPVGCLPGELVVKVVCCVHVKLSYRVWFALVEPPLGCLPHSLMSYCWWLLAVCVCPKVMFMCVCPKMRLVSQWFVEPPVGCLPNSQVSYCWWLLSVVCMQSWVTEFGSHLWNLPMVIFYIHRWVTADGCLLCVCAKVSHGWVHNNLWNLLLVVYYILCWLRSVRSL